MLRNTNYNKECPRRYDDIAARVSFDNLASVKFSSSYAAFCKSASAAFTHNFTKQSVPSLEKKRNSDAKLKTLGRETRRARNADYINLVL